MLRWQLRLHPPSPSRRHCRLQAHGEAGRIASEMPGPVGKPSFIGERELGTGDKIAMILRGCESTGGGGGGGCKVIQRV